MHSFAATTTVQFDALSPAAIAAYVASGEPFDKAGSYGGSMAGGGSAGSGALEAWAAGARVDPGCGAARCSIVRAEHPRLPLRTHAPMVAGIQGLAGSFVRGIDGCFFNVVGFPLHRLGVELGALIESGALRL